MAESIAETCPSLVDLERWIDGDHDADLTPHVERCAECAKQVRDIRDNNELLSRIEKSSIPESGSSSGGLPTGVDAREVRIDGYEILSELHRGGQGVVYRAIQKATNRPVAVKVLLAGTLATSRQRRRFEREIELIAQLNHPNIVTVYDSGVAPDGRHYLVMEHIEGQPLDQWLGVRRLVGASVGKLDVGRVVKLFGRICNGVSFAHQHGVIHRDLKPANILVDDHGQPRILDFGLARTMIDDTEQRQEVSVAGEFMGTLAYAAPEQTTGDPTRSDVRTDVYALGVLLYQALTGTFPYAIDGELVEVLTNIREQDPRPMARRPEGGDRIDADLQTIVRTALAKDKDRRYQSVAALRDDLHHHQSGEPINARRDSGWYVLRKTMSRYRVQTATAAAFVLLLAVFGVAMSVAYNRARTEADKVSQINIFLEDTLGSVEAGQTGDEVTLRELLDEAVQWIEIALSDQEEIAASIQTTVGNSYRNLGLHEQAEIQLSRALATRRDLFGDDHEQVAQSLSHLALLRRDQGERAEAERLWNDSLDIRLRRGGEETFEVAITYANLGLLKRDQDDYAEAERLIRASLDIRRSLYGPTHQDVAMCLFHLATIEARRGNVEAAIEHHQQALAMRRRVLHQKHPDLSRSLLALGIQLVEAGRPEEAERLLIECVEHRSEVLAADDENLAEAVRALESCRAALRQRDGSTTPDG